jgi:hypothetical protein
MEDQPTPSSSSSWWFNSSDLDDESVQYPKLLSLVTGLGELHVPSDHDFYEADMIIHDPNIPCSDLRGDRDKTNDSDKKLL